MKNLINRYKDADKQFLESLGIEYPYKHPGYQWKDNTDKDKYLILADLHEPYADDITLRKSLEHKDAETVIVVGDIGDYYSKSRFRKTRVVSFKEELRSIFLRLQWLSVHFKKVKIIKGNHDNRPEKKIAELFAGEIDLLILTERDVLARLISYFDNIELVGTKIRTFDGDDINVDHIWQMGDVIFTHGELSRAQETATMEYISKFLRLWKDELGLKNYSVIIQAHNHGALKSVKGTELWLMTPCSMQTKSVGAEYVFSPKMIGKPPTRGYSLLYQSKGKTDWNKTNFYVNE